MVLDARWERYHVAEDEFLIHWSCGKKLNEGYFCKKKQQINE